MIYDGSLINRLIISVYENDLSLEQPCKEVLWVTKMNWNNTQLDSRRSNNTLECTQKIGDIIKYIPSHERPQRSNSLQ